MDEWVLELDVWLVKQFAAVADDKSVGLGSLLSCGQMVQ